MKAMASTFVAVTGLSACTGVAPPGPGDPYAIPYEALSEKQAEPVHKVMDAPSVMVELERTAVKSRPDIYVYLMDELPFTAGVLRELGESKYEISRDAKGGYLFDDKAGLILRAELVFRDDRRWIWSTLGTYSLGIFGTARGRSVIIVRYENDGGALLTEARVYAKLEDKLLDSAAKALKGAVEKIIRDKSFVFIKAAKLVAEIAARDASGLVDTVRGSAHVDAAELEEFRRRFVR
jgi:hypothetical protein